MVVFTHRLLSSLIFVSVGTLMDRILKKVMILDTLMKFLNLYAFVCKRSVIANTLMSFQIIAHFFVTIVQFYEKLIFHIAIIIVVFLLLMLT